MHETKKEKSPYWKRIQKQHISSGDSALFLVSFTAIFGILCHEPGSSIYFVCVSAIYVAFWLYMMFSGGRFRRRGTWLTALLLWGSALLYGLLNWTLVVPMGNPETLGGFLGAVMVVAYIPASALMNPLFPLLYRCGYSASADAVQNAEFLLVLVGVVLLVLAAAFFTGMLYEKKCSRAETK